MFKARHGDVIITQVETVLGSKKHGQEIDAVVAEGEVTGHFHRFKSGQGVELFEDNGVLYVKVNNPDGATITHEEHNPITVPKGGYKITIQREYDDELEWRRVAD